jgi:hypothetical protein
MGVTEAAITLAERTPRKCNCRMIPPRRGAGNNGPVSTATASSFLNAAGTMGGTGCCGRPPRNARYGTPTTPSPPSMTFTLGSTWARPGSAVTICPASSPRALGSNAQIRWLRAVQAWPSARDKALALTPFYAGLRIGDLVALDIDDVRLSARKGTLAVCGRAASSARSPCTRSCALPCRTGSTSAAAGPVPPRPGRCSSTAAAGGCPPVRRGLPAGWAAGGGRGRAGRRAGRPGCRRPACSGCSSSRKAARISFGSGGSPTAPRPRHGTGTTWAYHLPLSRGGAGKASAAPARVSVRGRLTSTSLAVHPQAPGCARPVQLRLAGPGRRGQAAARPGHRGQRLRGLSAE